jgi:hypothetical protein|tara:strand:- start:234 stop:767 length:534 start_codon:yes stop_codon:yes gene_type:complete
MNPSYQSQYPPQQSDTSNMGLLATGALAGGGIATLAALKMMNKGKILQDLSQKGAKKPTSAVNTQAINKVAGQTYDVKNVKTDPVTNAQTIYYEKKKLGRDKGFVGENDPTIAATGYALEQPTTSTEAMRQQYLQDYADLVKLGMISRDTGTAGSKGVYQQNMAELKELKKKYTAGK